MSTSYIKTLQCVGLCQRVFTVVLEREGDLTMSHVTDAGQPEQGYALYRDNVLVKCPDCKSFCRVLDGGATVKIAKVR